MANRLKQLWSRAIDSRWSTFWGVLGVFWLLFCVFLFATDDVDWLTWVVLVSVVATVAGAVRLRQLENQRLPRT